MRVDFWQDRLQAVFDSAHGRRFRWGRHDCCQFAARCIEAVTGRDHRQLFPMYRTRPEAERILAAEGGMQALLSRALGEPVHVSRACRGDIVLIETNNGLQPAVCAGIEVFWPGRRTLVPWPTARASAAWVF